MNLHRRTFSTAVPFVKANHLWSISSYQVQIHRQASGMIMCMAGFVIRFTFNLNLKNWTKVATGLGRNLMPNWWESMNKVRDLPFKLQTISIAKWLTHTTCTRCTSCASHTNYIIVQLYSCCLGAKACTVLDTSRSGWPLFQLYQYLSQYNIIPLLAGARDCQESS